MLGRRLHASLGLLIKLTEYMYDNECLVHLNSSLIPISKYKFPCDGLDETSSFLGCSFFRIPGVQLGGVDFFVVANLRRERLASPRSLSLRWK